MTRAWLVPLVLVGCGEHGSGSTFSADAGPAGWVNEDAGVATGHLRDPSVITGSCSGDASTCPPNDPCVELIDFGVDGLVCISGTRAMDSLVCDSPGRHVDVGFSIPERISCQPTIGF